MRFSRESGAGKSSPRVRRYNRISDSLAVGWTGRKFVAANIIKKIISRFSASPASLIDLQTLFSNETGYETVPCTIIGWVIENGSSQLFRWESVYPKKFETATNAVEGKGSDHFRDIFHPTHVGGTGNAVRNALTRITNILGHEVLYGTNLWNLYGGGFQIIYLADGKFRVLPSVTFNFLYAKEDGYDVKFGVEKRILKTLYREETFYTLALLVNRMGEVGTPEMHYS